MGISIEVWRARMGSFKQPAGLKQIEKIQPFTTTTTWSWWNEHAYRLLLCTTMLMTIFSSEGGASDGETWKNCTLHDAVEENRVGLPEPAPLPNDEKPMLYHFVGNDAFALRTWLMKPSSHRSQVHEETINSYRLSRAPRVVENAFGILSHRFRCFLTMMQHHLETINLITMCACVVHNLILTRYPLAKTDVDHEDPATHALIPGAWREDCDMEGFVHLSGHNSRKETKEQHDYLSHYYLSPLTSKNGHPMSRIHI